MHEADEVVGVLFLGREDRFHQPARGRVLLSDVLRDLAIALDRDALGDEILADHVLEAAAFDVLRVRPLREAVGREIGRPPELDDALAVLPADTDLVLVEGYKRSDFPKLEVFRPGLGRTPLWDEVPGVVAVASDDVAATAAMTSLPVLDLNDADAVFAFIRDYSSR